MLFPEYYNELKKNTKETQMGKVRLIDAITRIDIKNERIRQMFMETIGKTIKISKETNK